MDALTQQGTEKARPGGRSVRAVIRRWWVLALALVVVVVAWRMSMTAVYLAGLVLTVVGVLVALRGHRYWAAAAAVVVVVLGIGGPWLGVRLAYRDVGVPVSAHVESYPDYVASVGDVALLAQHDTVLAVDDTGTLVWQADLPDLAALWPLTDGRLLARLDGELVAIDGGTDGERAWSRPLVSEGRLVAATEDVVVQRLCVETEVPATCTWTGIDLADGADLWDVTGVWAPGWTVRNGEQTSIARRIETSLFTVQGEDDQVEVYDADTGQALQVLRGPDLYPVLLGDAVLVFRLGDECSVELVRAAGSQWTSGYPCALWNAPDSDLSPVGSRAGDAYWGVTADDGGTLVLDLRDGTVREEPTTFGPVIFPYGFEDPAPVEVLGAAIDVQLSRDGLVGRDPVDETHWWEAGVPGTDIRAVQVSSGVVVVSRYHRPLLLHEWFAPEDPRTVVVEVLDAVSGERRAVVRTEGWSSEPTLVGDRVLLEVADLGGEPTLRLVG